MNCVCRVVVLLSVFAGAFAPGDAVAQEEKGAFGLGLVVGDPTGATGKLYLSDDTAIAGALGLAVLSHGLHAHADFLWHPVVLAREEHFVLPAYVGIGGRLLDHDRGPGESDDLHVGVRFVGGLLFDFRELPLGLFAEAAVIADFSNASDGHGGAGVDVDVALGARYYF